MRPSPLFASPRLSKLEGGCAGLEKRLGAKEWGKDEVDSWFGWNDWSWKWGRAGQVPPLTVFFWRVLREAGCPWEPSTHSHLL